MLTTNCGLTAEKVLELYRVRGKIEDTFRDMKHGIDWRPARCTSEMVIKGGILISFLAPFCMSMIRFLCPQYCDATAELLCEELSPFSLTVLVQKGESKKRIFSNFWKFIHLIRGQKSLKRCQRHPVRLR